MTIPMDFFPLLLHGTTKSSLFDWLFVSQRAITGTPIRAASSTAFLSVQGSQTKTIFGSVNVFRFVLVKIPGGYRPLMTFIPVSLLRSFSAFQPLSLLLHTRISSGL